eukprot:m.55883 g.55883  ORF g.55883 m.55883 type:complete len:408 (+) comp13668_c0_seq1:178-1401(+)
MVCSLISLAALLGFCLANRVDFGGNLDASTGFDSKNFAVWADMNATKLLDLQPGSPAGTWAESWPISENSKHPFKHVFTQFNPAGHPPFDGFGGGYGAHHIDMHFYAITPEERLRDAVCSSFPPCINNSVSAKIFSFPPSQVIPKDFFVLPSLSGVPEHGMHWEPWADKSFVRPLDAATVDNPAARLGDCLSQAAGGPDKGCRMAPWYPGFSPIYISLDGKTAALEIMFTVAFVDRLKRGDIPNPYIITFPQVDGELTDLSPPVFAKTIFAVYNPATDVVRFGMDLKEYNAYACPKHCKTCDADLVCSECKSGYGLAKGGSCKRCNAADDGYCSFSNHCALEDDGSFCRANRRGECKQTYLMESRPCTFGSCSMLNCQFCKRRDDGTQRCKQCAEGYSLSGGVCVEA